MSNGITIEQVQQFVATCSGADLNIIETACSKRQKEVCSDDTSRKRAYSTPISTRSIHLPPVNTR